MYLLAPLLCSSGIVLSPYLLISCLLNNPYHRGAGDGSGACQDKAADVGDDFDHDKPPRVVDFHFGWAGRLWVVEDFLDLLVADFDFHLVLVFDDLWILTGRFSKVRERLELS